MKGEKGEVEVVRKGYFVLRVVLINNILRCPGRVVDVEGSARNEVDSIL